MVNPNLPSNSASAPGFLILAAGKATRFGGNKLTAMLDNKPVIQHCLDTLIQTHLPIAMVYSPGDLPLVQYIQDYNIKKIPYLSENIGMGSSLAWGVQHTANWNGWVICLGDMPWISLSTYQKIALSLSNHDIVRPCTSLPSEPNLQFGHPVGFQASFKQELLALTGDEGARSIISTHKSALCSIEVQDYGILLDIDQPSDLNRSPYTV